MKKKKHNEIIIGLMSGTSIDGIDLAVAEFRDKSGFCKNSTGTYFFYPYPKKIKKELLNIFKKPKNKSKKIRELDYKLGVLYADAVIKSLKELHISHSSVKGIGCHGQTVWHNPYGKNPFSLQIGNPNIILKKTKIPVIYNFREKDILAGGQGAPLTPYLDWFIFKNKKKNMILINIGGISNITFIPQDGSIKNVIGFDTGPGNMLIDNAMRYYFKKDYDKNGIVASKGKTNELILKKLLSHKYFDKKPPKSTGHEDFGVSYFNTIKNNFHGLKKEDIITTLTAFTSYSIFQQIEQILIKKKVKEIIFSGGGAKNKTILKIFNNLLKENEFKITVKTFDQLKLPFSSDAKEAVLMALLAYCHTRKIPSNIPYVTGARERVVLGSVIS